MLFPPTDIVALLSPFAPLFSCRVWRHVPLLVVGAILAPGRRMVSTVLRTVGLSQEQHFHTILRDLYGDLTATGMRTGSLHDWEQ